MCGPILEEALVVLFAQEGSEQKVWRKAIKKKGDENNFSSPFHTIKILIDYFGSSKNLSHYQNQMPKKNERYCSVGFY